MGFGIKIAALSTMAGSIGTFVSSCVTEVKAKTKLFHASYWGPFRPTVVNGVLTKVSGIKELDDEPTEMLTMGVLEKTYAKTRVNYPLVRKSYLENFGGDIKAELRGKEPFVRVSWEVAFDLVKKALDKTIGEHGNESILTTYDGWAEGKSVV